MTDILFIRHGESIANEKKIFAGNLDYDLSEKGLRQANAVCDYIFNNYSVNAIFSSDLKRAINTVKRLSFLTKLKIIRKKDLREINSGLWQGKTFDYIMENYKNSYSVWLNDIGFCVPEGGESMEQVEKRVYSCVKKIVSKNLKKTVVICTHATAIKAFSAKVLYNDLSEMKNIKWLTNASLTHFLYDEKNDKFTLKFAGLNDYLKEDKTPFFLNV